MHLRLILLWLWLPLLALPWALVTATHSSVLGFQLGWLLILPLLGLSAGALLGALNALRKHNHQTILPNYQSLDQLAQIRQSVTDMCLRLPAMGACGVSLLLCEAIQTHSALPGLGLPLSLTPPHQVLPALATTLPYWSSGLVLPLLAAPFLWPQWRRWWWLGSCGLLGLLLLQPEWMAACAHPSTRRGWLMGVTVGGCLWIAMWWGLRHWAPKRTMRWAWQWGLGIYVGLYHVGALLTYTLSPAYLRAVVGALLLLPYVLLGINDSKKAIVALWQLQQNTSTQLWGASAYLLGATWPAAMLLAWIGWLYFGGAGYQYSIQQHPLAMLLILVAQTISFAAFSALDTLHSARLHPPSRAWLLARPLLLYITLAVTLGIPAMAMLKDSFS